MALYYEKRQLILTALLTILLGSALHFLYTWMPNGVTALFSPISESLWEHVKILFWPYLLAALWLNRGRPGGMRPWCLTLLLMCALMLILGFGYHILLDGRAMWVDIALYCLLMILGFWLPSRFSGPFSGFLWLLPCLLAGALAVAIGLFTLWPPRLLLFADLSLGKAWLPLPC